MKIVAESRSCKRGCCWNNWGTCGRAYACACHATVDSTPAARARLQDYLDSLGDDE